jgi:hypothetical protein
LFEGEEIRNTMASIPPFEHQPAAQLGRVEEAKRVRRFFYPPFQDQPPAQLERVVGAKRVRGKGV